MIKKLGFNEDIRMKYYNNLNKVQVEEFNDIIDKLVEVVHNTKYRITCPLCGEIIEYSLEDEHVINERVTAYDDEDVSAYINCPTCQKKLYTWGKYAQDGFEREEIKYI